MTIPRNDLVSNQLSQGMAEQGAVELPFPVIYMWAINGQGNQKQQGGAAYFGGFAGKGEQIDPAIDAMGINLPTYFVPTVVNLRDDTEYEGYSSRYLTLVPIAKRERWMMKDEHGFKLHYDKQAGATRQHIQILSYLADTENKTIAPWGPMVVSAKGYQAKFINDALKQWDKATLKMRASIAPGWPSNAFWCSIGTFGKERQAVMVGPQGSQSPVTPISLYIPNDFSEAHLEKLWIGEALSKQMVTLLGEANEWLNAWKVGLEDGPSIGAVTTEQQPPDFQDDYESRPF